MRQKLDPADAWQDAGTLAGPPSRATALKEIDHAASARFSGAIRLLVS